MKNSHLIEPEIIKYNLETWRYGVADAFYEPTRNEIHVLSPDDLYIKAMWHEREHHDRSNRLTFKLAMVMSTPALAVMLIGFFIVFSVYAVLSTNLIPALFTGCLQYEEYKANQGVLRELQRYKDTGVIEL